MDIPFGIVRNTGEFSMGTSGGVTDDEANEELVRRVQYDTYTGREDLDVIDVLISDGFVQHDPSAGDVHGPDGFREDVETWRSAFSDIAATIHRMIAEGDLVGSHYTARGTHVGPIPDLDLEPTGETFEIEGWEFDRIEDGKLVETWHTVDTLGLLRQLGALSDEASRASDDPSE
jgi:predicted ester cyclase